MMTSCGTPVTLLTPPSSLVAVCQDVLSPHWRRAVLETLTLWGSSLRATVFLTDYGTRLSDLEVQGRVMLLPQAMYKLPPLAFRVVLAGLQPASMDLDFLAGRDMEVVVARTWDSAARREVETLLAGGRLAELRDWVGDGLDRCHGRLVLLRGQEEELCINDFLVKKQFALFSQQVLEQELARVTEEGEVARQLEESFGSDIFSDDEEEYDEIEKKLEDISIDPPRVAKIGYEQELKSSKTFNTALISVARGDADQAQEPAGGREEVQNKLGKLLLELRASKVQLLREKEETEESEEDMWSSFQGGSSGGVDDSSRAASNLLPGGVLVGKYHENVLVNLHADGLRDQKEKFEKFVMKQ